MPFDPFAGFGGPRSGDGSPLSDDPFSSFGHDDMGSPEQPGLGSKILGGIQSVVGAPKAGVDYLLRQYARSSGLPVADDATAGQMLRSGLGLNQGDEGYAGKLAGKSVEFLEDAVTDPLSYASFGAGKVAKAAQVGFTGLMGTGAVQEAGRLKDTISREGFTPEAAEQALGTLLGVGGTYLGGRHLMRRPTPGAGTSLAEMAAERAVPEAARITPEAPPLVDPAPQRLIEPETLAPERLPEPEPVEATRIPGPDDTIPPSRQLVPLAGEGRVKLVERESLNPKPLGPDVTQEIRLADIPSEPPVNAATVDNTATVTPTVPAPGTVKPATIFQPERTTPDLGPTKTTTPRGAALLEMQAKALQEAGLKDFPWITKDVSSYLFDGDGALANLKNRATQAQGRAFDLGTATAEGAGVLKDLSVYGASLIERGIRSFPEWSAAMMQKASGYVKGLKNHLETIFTDAVDTLTKTAKDFGYTFLGVGEAPVRDLSSQQGAVAINALVPGFGSGVPAPAAPPAPTAPPPTTPPPSAPPAAVAPAVAPVATATAAPKATLFDKALEFWKSGLVSGPGTHVANPASSVLEGGARAAEAGVAGLVDQALTALYGGKRTRFSSEAVAQMRGGIARVPKAVSALSDGLKNVLDSEGAIGGTKGKVTRVPLQMLGIEDAATSQLHEGASLAGLAHRAAKKQLPGGKPADVDALAAQLEANPTPELLEAVQKEVRERQFKADDNPDTLVKRLTNLRNRHKWMHVVLPFVETPAKIAELTIKRSPAGFVEAGHAYKKYREAIKSGAAPEVIEDLKGKAVDKISRPLVGTMVLGTFAAVAKAGGMTGSGPKDRKERQLLLDTGWQPYSFVIPGKDGNTYIPFNRFEPVSGLLGFAADMAEARNAKDANDIFSKALGSIAQNLTSKTYLGGLSEAAALINDPAQFGGEYISNLAASAVPNVVSKVAQAIDPVLRDTKPEESGFAGLPEKTLKKITSRLPGLSQTLPARRTATGEDAVRAGNAATRLLSPVQPSFDKPEKALERFLLQVGDEAIPTAPGRELTIPNTNGVKIRLTDEEYDTLQDSQKRAAEYVRQRYMNNPRFLRLPADEQQRRIKQAFDEGKRSGRERLFRDRRFRARAKEAVAARAS
jgi:hypothetical protein